MNLNSHDIENNMLLQHSKKTSWIYQKNVSANMFLFGVRKSICTPPFLDDAQNCILEALWKQMSDFFCIYP